MTLVLSNSLGESQFQRTSFRSLGWNRILQEKEWNRKRWSTFVNSHGKRGYSPKEEFLYFSSCILLFVVQSVRMNYFLLFACLISVALASENGQCAVEQSDRYNCLPNENSMLFVFLVPLRKRERTCSSMPSLELWFKKAECEKLNCCWVPDAYSFQSNACYYPMDYGYNTASMEKTSTGFVGTLTLNTQYPPRYPEYAPLYSKSSQCDSWSIQ